MLRGESVSMRRGDTRPAIDDVTFVADDDDDDRSPPDLRPTTPSFDSARSGDLASGVTVCA
jgi:hypothetical protein